MRPLLITLEYPPFHGGIASYYGNLVERFPAKLRVLDNAQNKLVNKVWHWLPGLINIWKECRREKIDYLLVGHILPLGTIARLLSFVLPLKYCVFLHGLDWPASQRRPRKRWLTKKILQRANQIICANNYTAAQVKLTNPKLADKITVVNPGVPRRPAFNQGRVENLQRLYNLQGRLALFSLGRLVLRKGVDEMIKLLPSLLEAIPNLTYLVAGSGPDETYLRQLGERLPAETKEQLHFLGSVSEADKWLWLDLCDIFVMPAKELIDDYEGFGIVYLEAALAGKPVIAGRSGGVEEAVIEGATGLIVDAADKQALIRAVVKLAQDPELRRQLGKTGQTRALNEFSWQKRAEKIWQIISVNG